MIKVDGADDILFNFALVVLIFTSGMAVYVMFDYYDMGIVSAVIMFVGLISWVVIFICAVVVYRYIKNNKRISETE